MKIQPMRKKTLVSVHTSWPIQGLIAKTSSPFNLVSKFTADRDQSEKKSFRIKTLTLHISGWYQDNKMPESQVLFFYSIYFQV
jgi:hypothetical protein